LKDFTEKYTDTFFSDLEKLQVKKADNVEAVSNIIPEMARMINTMLRRGVAYIAEDKSIYFKIKEFSKY
jgi:cysteinyl-tRNA synthetase